MGADAMAQREDEFGVYRCDTPEYPDAWVRFRLTGYPFKLRRQMEEITNDREAMLLMLPRVADWSVRDADGREMPSPAECLAQPELLDNLEDPILFWLMRAFWAHRAALNLPRKN